MRKQTITGYSNSHFVTFGCAGRRRLLNTTRSRQIVISVLGDLVDRDRVRVCGFVVMPDHVHAILWYPEGDGNHSKVMQTWKRLSSHYLTAYYQRVSPETVSLLDRSYRGTVKIWTPRFHDFTLFNPDKAREKLTYMHQNPVKWGLAGAPEEYRWSSAPWYVQGRSVGVTIDPGLYLRLRRTDSRVRYAHP